MRKMLFAVALAALPAMGQASTSGYLENTVVFGDSLSDAGFFGFQFTDTDVWAAQLGIDAASGRNFAVGGARSADGPGSFDFAEQRALFAANTPDINPYTNAVIWFGANDLLNYTGPETITNAVLSLTAGILDLRLTYGINRFVIAGLPDLGLTPRNLGTANQIPASVLTGIYNEAVETLVDSLSIFGIRARYADIYTAVNDAFADPTAFSNITDPCNIEPSCDGYAFWDSIHPTGQGHARLADVFSAELAAIPLPAGAPLLLGGLGGLILLRRKRKSAVAA